jgi:hypothetical protein
MDSRQKYPVNTICVFNVGSDRIAVSFDNETGNSVHIRGRSVNGGENIPAIGSVLGWCEE